jgi:hypothetical protein
MHDRINLLMDRKGIGIIFFGVVVIMIAVVISLLIVGCSVV